MEAAMRKDHSSSCPHTGQPDAPKGRSSQTGPGHSKSNCPHRRFHSSSPLGEQQPRDRRARLPASLFISPRVVALCPRSEASFRVIPSQVLNLAMAMVALGTNLNDAHRQFLQAFLTLGFVERPEAAKLHQLYCQLHKVHYVPDKLDDFINTLNGQLQPLSLEIRKGVSEENGRTYYALVNLAETEITLMASDYSENELELFKKTMDLIVLSSNGFASSTEILNLADQLKPKKMKKVEAELVLQRLVQDKWLSEKEGEYTLHLRCVLELEQYILRHYQDSARKCHVCHSLSIQSQVCEDCGIAMHLPCLAKYFQAQREPRCPNCKQFWPHQIPEINLPGPSGLSSTPQETWRSAASPMAQRRQ